MDNMNSNNIIIGILIFFIGIYFVFGAFLFFTQKSVIYYPDNQDFESCEGFKDYQKINYNGTRLYYKQGLNDNVIIYYHGNAGSACSRSQTKSTFEQSGSSLIFVEYAGYSNDSKKPSQKLIFEDVENVYNFVQEKFFKKVLIYGQSIGSGVASYHAYLGNVDSLILVMSFSRLSDVAQSKYTIYPLSILLREKYNNAKWLQDFGGSIIMLHGDSDLIIPHKFSEKLFNKLSTQDKEYVLIEGKGHNSIWSSSIFKDKIIKFINDKL